MTQMHSRTGSAGGSYSSSSMGMGGGGMGGGQDEGRGMGGGRQGPRRAGYLKRGVAEELYVDYKAVEDLRRAMTPNGKIYSRKRLGTTAREQRMLSQAVKRARYMALLPYTDATL